QGYTLIASVADLERLGDTATGHFALANDLDLSGKVYDKAVVGTLTVGSTFAGLGHTIDGLTIVNLGSSSASPGAGDLGLFGTIGAFGAAPAVVRDIHLTTVNINNPTGTPTVDIANRAGIGIGALAATNSGIIYGASVKTDGYIVGSQLVGGLVS